MVRVPRSELAEVCLHHIRSGIDVSLAATDSHGTSVPESVLSGYTQWGATWHGREIQVCWNWGVSGDLLFVLNPAAIKANILLVDETAAAESFLLSRAHLLEWIEGHPWRDPVRKVIALL